MKLTAAQIMKWVTVAAVLAIAAVGGYVSYGHDVSMVTRYGEVGIAGELTPATFEAPMLVASMSILAAARSGAARPTFAWCLFWAGIAASFGLNWLYGSAHGPIGGAIATWPAATLVASFHLMMHMIVPAKTEPEPVTVTEPELVVVEEPAIAVDPVRVVHNAIVAFAEKFKLKPDQVDGLRTLMDHDGKRDIRTIIEKAKVGQPRAYLIQALLAELEPVHRPELVGARA